MRERFSPVLVALAAAVLAGGCEPTAPPPSFRHETLWQDGDDRIEIDKREESTLRETLLSYHVRLVRKEAGVPVLEGATKKQSFSAVAGRLPDGRLVLLAHTVVCATVPAGRLVCVDLDDVGADGRSPSSCTSVVHASASCRGAFDGVSEPLAEALRWVAASPEVRVELRVAAIVTLARRGDVSPEISASLEKVLSPTYDMSIWFGGALARVHGEAFRIDALRRTLAGGSQHDRMIVVQSCVPELAGDVDALRKTLSSTRPEYAAEIEQAEKECAALPLPR